MLAPTTVSQGSDALLTMLELFSKPEELKTQLEDMKVAAESAREAETALVEERVQLRNQSQAVDENVRLANSRINDLVAVMDKAAKIVSDAEMSKIATNSQIVAIVREGEKLLEDMSQRADGVLSLLDGEVDARMQQLMSLERAAEAAEGRLERVEKRLEELRGSIGV